MECNQATLAKICGVTRAAISSAVKRGRLAENAAGFIDTDNTHNKRYLNKHKAKIVAYEKADGYTDTAAPPQTPAAWDKASDEDIAAEAGSAVQLLKMPIRELILKYHGLKGLDGYVKRLRDMTAIAEREQKIHERRLQLISRDFVVARVFQFIDVLMKKALDWPAQNADSLLMILRLDENIRKNEMIKMMENGISDILASSKQQIIDELDGLYSKYQEHENPSDLQKDRE